MTLQETDQDKEEFKKGLSDKQLLNQIQDWEKESEEFYTALKSIWQENLDYYKGLQTGVQFIHGKQSKAVENRIFMSFETIIPITTARLPDVIVRSGAEDEQSQMDASDLQDVLNYHFDRVKIQEKGEKFIRDLLIKRYGVFKVGWNQSEDDVELRQVEPKRIRIPKHGKSVHELKFVLEELELSWESMVEYFGEKKAKEALTQTKHWWQSGDKRRKKNFQVLEVWTNEFVAWKIGQVILNKKENPYFKGDGTDFFTRPQKPYIIKSLFETEDCLIGDTDYIQQVKALQDNLNTSKRLVENIARKVSNPPLLIDSEVMSEEQASSITNEEGLIIYGKDAAAGTKIRFESPGQVPQHLFQEMVDTRSTLDNIIGTHSATRGERQGRETLGGRQLLREADLGRIDLIARQLERALDEVAEWWTQLIKIFYTEEKSFSILGEDGIRFVKNFTGAKVGQAKPQVRQGSTIKEDDFEIAQKAIVLWQNKGIGLKTLYKMLKLPNMKEALEDYAQTMSGQTSSQQTGLPAQPLI